MQNMSGWYEELPLSSSTSGLPSSVLGARHCLYGSQEGGGKQVSRSRIRVKQGMCWQRTNKSKDLLIGNSWYHSLDPGGT